MPLSTPTPAGDVALAPALQALSGQWNIDRRHSRIGFSVRHANYFDGARPSASRAELVIRVDSVDTRAA